MIQVWRLCQSTHQKNAFSGDGARRYGGRWNHKGLAAIYTAATQSLAALEILVHADTDLIPNDFVVFSVGIPDTVNIERITVDQLAVDWRQQYPPEASQKMGTNWLQAQNSAVLQVPSAIIPSESNYIINPQHLDFHKLIIGKSQMFYFDPRLW